jgi:hypothetical protein
MRPPLKTFLFCDDRSENFFISKIVRRDSDIKSEFSKLKIGEILKVDQFRYWIRQN